MVTILISPPEGEPYSFVLPKGACTAGRHADCGLVLDHSQISRRHALFAAEGEMLTVSDLGSQNGTWVNGQRLLGPRQIQGSDRLQLGVFTIQLVADLEHPVEARSDERIQEVPSLVEGRPVKDEAVFREAFSDNPILGKLREIGALDTDDSIEPLVTAGSDLDPLRLFSQLSELLHSSRSLESFMKEVLSLAIAVTHSETGAVVLVREDGSLVPFVSKRVGLREDGPVPISGTVVRAALEQEACITSTDATKDARFADKPRLPVRIEAGVQHLPG